MSRSCTPKSIAIKGFFRKVKAHKNRSFNFEHVLVRGSIKRKSDFEMWRNRKLNLRIVNGKLVEN